MRAKDRVAQIKARVEEISHGPLFSSIWPHRAITAINNCFEWVDEGCQEKQPYISRHRNQSPILCTVIGHYLNKEHVTSEHDGFVIITVDSVGGMVDIHDRWPVALPSDRAQEWLDPAVPSRWCRLRASQQRFLNGSRRIGRWVTSGTNAPN